MAHVLSIMPVADLFVYEIENGTETRVDVQFHSPRIQRQRKFVAASRYLQDYAPTPDGARLGTDGSRETLHDGKLGGSGSPARRA